MTRDVRHGRFAEIATANNRKLDFRVSRTAVTAKTGNENNNPLIFHCIHDKLTKNTTIAKKYTKNACTYIPAYYVP